MAGKKTARAARLRRHVRVRKNLRGTADRPRLAVFRSNRYVYAQVIDDDTGRTLAQASDLEQALRGGGNTKSDRAKSVGQLIAQRAKAVQLHWRKIVTMTPCCDRLGESKMLSTLPYDAVLMPQSGLL